MIHYHKKRCILRGTNTMEKKATRFVTVDKLFSHLYVHLGVRIHVVKQLLVVDVLLIPFQSLVVAEVISQGHEKHLAAVEFGLFAVLIQEELCPG